MTFVNARNRGQYVAYDATDLTYAGTGKGFAASDHAKPHGTDLLHKPVSGYALIDMGKGFGYFES